MAITACTTNEYVLYTGATETPHPIYTDSENNIYIQCGLVLLGGDGLFN